MNSKPTITQQEVDEVVNAVFAIWASFTDVDLKTVNGITTGRKIKTVDGKTEDDRTDYIVSAIEGQTLPVDGVYPIELFEDVYPAANIYPFGYTGETKIASNNKYLDFIGKTKKD
jgi:hypothetical protein